MSKQLQVLLKTFADFDQVELDMICSAFTSKRVNRNTLLLNRGEICQEVYFVSKGCIRTFFITNHGSEKTRLIHLEGSMATAFVSFVNQVSTMGMIEAVEDTELLVIHYADFYRLMNESRHWKEFYQKILEIAYTFQNKKIEKLVTLTAKQRYESVQLENPVLVQRVSSGLLASYFDIREETLSRIKGR